jgi:hypothetical protein
MRKLLALLALLLATPAMAQVPSWQGGGGPSTGTTFPNGSTPVTSSNLGNTGATVTSIPAAAGKTSYLCGADIAATATAATQASTMTISGTIGGTMTFVQGVGASPNVVRTQLNFRPCIPANAANAGIFVTSIPAGTGGSTSVNAWGYQY